jgi:hypothetical protein
VDARQEPRFSIYGPVKVTLLSNPERALDCVLTEISATGIKIIAPESLAADEIISMEAEDHLALADVRYSQPRGDKFTIGCERIHVLNKVSLPDEKSKVEQIRILVEDYRNRISAGIATPRPDMDKAEAARLERDIAEKCADAPPEKAGNATPTPRPIPPPILLPPSTPVPGPFTTRQQMLEAATAWAAENWDKIPASPLDGPGGRSEIVDRLTFHLAEKLRPPTPAPQIVAEKAPQKAPQKTHQKVAPKTPKKINFRRWRIPAGLAAAALLGWGLSAVFWSLGSSGTASHIQSSIAALMVPKEKPAPAPVSSTRHATIKAVEPTWVMITVDGKRVLNKKMVRDDVREIEFSNKATLRIGNGKGLEITLDGKPIGPIGGRGQARFVELSATGFRLLPLN